MEKATVANPNRLIIEEVLQGINQMSNRLVDPLLEEIALIGIEDNRKGVLQQRAGDGSRLPAVTYRTGRAKRFVRFRSRKSESYGTAAHAFKGRTKWKAESTIKRNKRQGKLPNNNLTTAEYQKLSGPALAPRGEASRVITNHKSDWGRSSKLSFYVRWYWSDVVDVKGKAFLRHHFAGGGRLPKRDLRGIRPESRAKVQQAIRRFMDIVTRP